MPENDAPWEFLDSTVAESEIATIKDEIRQGKSLVQITAKLRQRVSPVQAGAILDLLQTRDRAARKFSRATQMFFVAKQLQQATGEAIAIYKSKRFENSQHVVDLCCGIGGDSIGLAKVCDLTVVDRDPQLVWMATRNVAVYGSHCRSAVQGAETFEVGTVDAFHIDPDRRPGEKRTVRAHQFQPNKMEIERLLEKNPTAAIKLAPASPDWSPEAESEFIGFDRECKQQIAWLGDLKTHACRRATVVDKLGNAIDSFAMPEPPTSEMVEVTEAEQFLIEPHACLLAAGLEDCFARIYGLQRLTSRVPFFTAPSFPPVLPRSLVSRFEIIDQCNLHRRDIQTMIRKHDVGVLDVKFRGLDPQAMKKHTKVTTHGSSPRTLFASPVENGHRVFLCQRME